MNIDTNTINITRIYVYVNGIKYPVNVEGNVVIVKPSGKAEVIGCFWCCFSGM